MAVDDVYKLTISATGQGSIYQNVINLQMKQAGDPTDSNFQSLIATWAAIFKGQQATSVAYTDYKAVQQWGPNMSIDAPRCRRLDGKEFAGLIVGQVGTGTGDMLPPQSSAVVTWTSGQSGRRKRGRTYAFGLVETVQAEGQWLAGTLVSWASNVQSFLNAYKGPDGTSPVFNVVVWSERTASGCIPATPPQKGHIQVDTPHPEMAATDITGFVVRPTVFTQRRRTRGVGR